MKKIEPWTGDLLAQADLLLLAARGLNPAWSGSRDSWAWGHGQTPRLLRLSGLGNHPGLGRALRVLEAQWRVIDRQAWSQEHHRLFEGATACPADEAFYIRRDKGAILGDLCGFYKAFGFTAALTGQRPDHLACELQFMALLLVMLAQARRLGRTEEAQVTSKALVSFAADHTGPWLDLFCDQLSSSAGLDFHRALAEFLRHLWLGLVQAWNLPQESPAGLCRLPLLEDSGTPYECGMAQEAACACRGQNCEAHGNKK